jgi:serine/threonine-protein kinase RsbW
MDELRRPDPREGPAGLRRLLEDDPADLYENAPCGYFSALPDGRLVKANRTFCEWTGRPVGELIGVRFQELLSIGGRVFYETHLAPLLRMQGMVREVALDVVRADGSLLPCLLNAVEVRDVGGAPLLVRATVFEATSRRRYERALLAAQRAAAESERRAHTLQQVVSEVSAAATARDVAEVIVRRSREAVGASGAALWLAGERRASRGRSPSVPPLELVAVDGIPPTCWRRWSPRRSAAPSWCVTAGCTRCREGRGCVRCGRAWPPRWTSTGRRRWSSSRWTPTAAPGRAGAAARGDGGQRADRPAAPGRAGHAGPGRRRPAGHRRPPGGQAIERVRLYEEMARHAERSAFLLDAARLMASAGDVTETAERLAELAVPRLADVCVIDLAVEHGLARAAARHGDPARQDLAAALRERHLPYRESPHPAVQAMELGRTVWIREVTDRWLAQITVDEEHLRIARALELVNLVCVPLLADGRVLGVLSLGSDRQRGAFTPADVEVAEQLALQVSQVVDKAQRLELETQTSHTLQGNLLPPARRRCRGWRSPSATCRPAAAPTSAATSTTSSRCPTGRWRWPWGTSSGTTSPPRR